MWFDLILFEIFTSVGVVVGFFVVGLGCWLIGFVVVIPLGYLGCVAALMVSFVWVGLILTWVFWFFFVLLLLAWVVFACLCGFLCIARLLYFMR